MNKLTKVLSVFIIAGAIGTGVAGVAGCTKKDNHTHAYTYTANSDGKTHNGACDCGKDPITNQNHVDENNDKKCDLCLADLGGGEVSDKLQIPAAAQALIVEGVEETEVQLSETKKSHSIDKSAVKVYFNVGTLQAPTKGDEVPAANLTVVLKAPNGQEVSEWTGLKVNGTYKLEVRLKNCQLAEGSDLLLTDFNSITSVNVINKVKADSLAVKTGEDVKFSQIQSSTDELTPTWKYEVTRENGDKEDVDASKVTRSGFDTTTAGENRVATLACTIEGISVSGSVKYTIVANANLVAQSFAMNFSFLTADQEAAVKAGEEVVLQDGRFAFKSYTGGEIASHDKTFDGKYFAKRIKFNGKSDAAKTDRYIKVHVDGPATLTVYAYHNAGTEGTPSNARQVGVFKEYTAATPSVPVSEPQDTIEKKDTKHVFSLPEAGDYYICCVGNGLTFTYVQVDQLVPEGEGVEEIVLGGEVVPAAISATHSSGKTQHVTIGTTWDSIKSQYTVKATGVNNVTCDSVETDVTAQATYAVPEDFATAIGEKVITVDYSGVKTTFKVIVDSTVSGIYGLNSSLKASVNTQLPSADAKLKLTKDDIVNTLVGENAEAAITAFTVFNGDTEMGADGLEFAVSDSEYVLTITATVQAGEQTATLTATITFTVEVASNDPTQSFLAPDALPTETALAAGATITENNLFKAIADGAMEYSIGKDATAGIPNSSKPVTVNLQDGTKKTFLSAIRTMADATIGANSTTVSITAKEKVTLKVYAIFCNSSYNSNKPAKLNYQIGDATVSVADTGANRQTPNTIEVTLEAGETLKLWTSGAADKGHMYLFGIEAKQITA